MVRQLTAIAALALTSVVAAAACKSPAVPLAPGPPGTTAPSSAASGTAPPDVAAPGTVAPSTVAPSPARPKPSQVAADPLSCMGAVVYRVNYSEGSFKGRVCIAVGGVVRVENLGPWNLSIDPSGLVSCWYEAAVRECRLIRTGTVTFKTKGVPNAGTFTVVISEASSPPKPSPACLSATTFTVDALDGGPPWSAQCVKLDVILRVENAGPDGSSAAPASMVSCQYEAGVQECRFVKAGTMTITTRNSVESRSLILVVIK
ncbi:MAG TPA: hypothetical protein VFC19_42310 [Candidatus Limnocylindrales bacterium]|nr:hypothetical protein [Candidatus Limnocylindrales bacterium]